ncbi:MAG TPA: pyridoxamine 5'-phosphate oxidase family protein [Arthrobacter sp.]|nr:pyridoxamine 5'-phosphate oxidase family protein [Arthrobacter sp.]
MAISLRSGLLARVQCRSFPIRPTGHLVTVPGPFGPTAVAGQSIYFRTAGDGSIAEQVPSLESSFQIDDSRADRSEGWSVLVSGPSSRVEDQDLLTRLWGKVMAEPWAGGARLLFVRIQAHRVSGRHVHLE